MSSVQIAVQRAYLINRRFWPVFAVTTGSILDAC
jgi:hypothetical protein